MSHSLTGLILILSTTSPTLTYPSSNETSATKNVTDFQPACKAEKIIVYLSKLRDEKGIVRTLKSYRKDGLVPLKLYACRGRTKEPCDGVDTSKFKSECRNSTYPQRLIVETADKRLMRKIFLLPKDQFITYFIGIIPSEFYVVLGHRDLRNFQFLSAKALVLIVAKAFALTTIKYSSYALYLLWRRTVDQKLHSLYFRRQAFYKLNVLNNDLDNPDQRMTQDVEKTTRLLATEILATLLISPFVIVYYTYLTYKSSGYMGPLAIYAYFVIATVINKFLLGPIVKLVVKQEKYEGDFRFKHVSVRTNAEAIGLYHSGSLERTMTNQKLENLISTQFQLIKRQLFLNFSTTTTDYIGGVLSYFIIAIPIFLLDEYAHMDPVDLTGVVSRNAFYYIYLISKFSVIIDLSSKIGDMSGTTHRIIQLFEKLEEIQEEPTAISLNAVVAENEGFPRRNGKASPNSSQRLLDPAHLSRNESEATDIYGSTHSGNPYQMSMERPIKTITLDNVSFGCPSDTEQAHLIKNLTLHVVLGTNILITGDSSSGKSSLIRVFAGLWNVSSGVFDGPRKYHPNKILFLPQKPYCPDSHASLAQQVMYPLRVQSNEVTPENTSKIESILESVRLSSLLTKCGGPLSPVPFDWLETLSPGELQRLSIARAFFHSPRLLFLDEATSALGFGLESELYSKLQKEGITTISVGHRLSLKRYHDYELHLDGKGGWTFSEIDLSTLEGTIADSTSTLGM